MMRSYLLLLAILVGVVPGCGDSNHADGAFRIEGYWACNRGRFFLAFVAGEAAFRKMNAMRPDDYNFFSGQFRVLESGKETIIDSTLDEIVNPLHVNFVDPDIILAVFNQGEIVCDRTTETLFASLKPQVPFPKPKGGY